MGLCTLSTLSLIELVMQLAISFPAAACGLSLFLVVYKVLVVHYVPTVTLIDACRFRPRVFVCHKQAIIFN